MAWNCEAFNDLLLDQSPHFDMEILKDWFPTDDAWIGHVATMPWDAFTGTTHVYDQVHVGAPDLSQAWDSVDLQTAGCIDNACTSSAIAVGWGETRKTYSQEKVRYQTNVLCFDTIDSKAKAKQLMAEIIKGIKLITKQVWSDKIRTASLMQQVGQSLQICGSALNSVTITAGMFTGNLTTIDLGAAGNLPTSKLTVQYLQRFYAQLQLNGYFKGKYVPNGMFKLVTDPIAANELCEQNPTLTSMYKFTDFTQGGQLFKYGMSRAIGNFGIAFDDFPARFYHIGNGVLRRVWPYTNVPTTIGIMPQVASEYILAPYQYSPIWHPEAMLRATPKLKPVHSEMPFLTRDLGGAWNFVGGNRDRAFVDVDPVTGDSCTVDNKAGNKGMWFADFRTGFKFEYPNWTVPILHLTEPGCVNDDVPCSTPPAYVIQDNSDSNPVCESD
jgi:hypothetical protein